MKNILLLGICCIILLIDSVCGQSLNEFTYAQVAVMKAGDNSKGIKISESSAKLREVLGAPGKIYDYYFELDDVTAKVYQYGLNLFYFVNDRLVIYDIYDDLVQVGPIGGTTYKFGDKLTVRTERRKLGPGSTYHTIVIKSFYDFKLVTTPGTTRNIPYSTLIKAVLPNTEATFEIVFDSNNSIINISTSAY